MTTLKDMPRFWEALRQLRDFPASLETEDDPAFTTEQVNFPEKRLYEVRSLLEGDDQSPVYSDINLYVHDLLAKHQQIAAICSVEDVKGVRPHLTDDQAWEVLERVGAWRGDDYEPSLRQAIARRDEEASL